MCPHCKKALYNGLCMDRLCTFSVLGGPDPDFTQLRLEMGEACFASTLATFGFGSADQIRSPKMRKVIAFVMRRNLAELNAIAELAIPGGILQ